MCLFTYLENLAAVFHSKNSKYSQVLLQKKSEHNFTLGLLWITALDKLPKELS
jgi:hypothetical protein